MKSIDEHIQKDQSEIESAKAEGNLPKVRHLTEELKELEEYKDHHPFRSLLSLFPLAMVKLGLLDLGLKGIKLCSNLFSIHCRSMSCLC